MATIKESDSVDFSIETKLCEKWEELIKAWTDHAESIREEHLSSQIQLISFQDISKDAIHLLAKAVGFYAELSNKINSISDLASNGPIKDEDVPQVLSEITRTLEVLADEARSNEREISLDIDRYLTAIKCHVSMANLIKRQKAPTGESDDNAITLKYIPKSQRHDISELRSGFPNLMEFLPMFRSRAKERS